MRRKIKEISWATLSAIVLGVAGNFVYDYVKGVPVIGYIFHQLRSLYEWVTGTLNWPIRMWVVLFLGMAVYFCYVAFQSIKRRVKPPFYHYTQDVFRKWIWRWKWEYSRQGWQIVNLRPYCRDCDVELVEVGSLESLSSKCPSCERYEQYQELSEEIVRLIRAKVDKKKYPKEN